MLRGMATITYFADDVTAAKDWYAELLGEKPYYASEDHGKPADYVEFRIGDYQHELGILDRRFSANGPAEPAGVTTYWHVDDVEAAVARAVELGARPHEAVRNQGSDFITATVVDPFGNVLGLMSNPHYLEILESR